MKFFEVRTIDSSGQYYQSGVRPDLAREISYKVRMINAEHITSLRPGDPIIVASLGNLTLPTCWFTLVSGEEIQLQESYEAACAWIRDLFLRDYQSSQEVQNTVVSSAAVAPFFHTFLSQFELLEEEP